MEGKKKQVIEHRRAVTTVPTTTLDQRSSNMDEEQVKLAALAISFDIRLKSADMPINMQEHAFRFITSLLHDNHQSPTPTPTPSPTLLARALKKEFDMEYGPLWHCVVGKSFGSFVTHSPGGFVYFSVDSLSFLLFKTEVHLVTDPVPLK